MTEFFRYGFKDGDNIYIYSIYLDRIIAIENILGIKLLDIVAFSRHMIVNDVKIRKKAYFTLRKILKYTSY